MSHFREELELKIKEWEAYAPINYPQSLNNIQEYLSNPRIIRVPDLHASLLNLAGMMGFKITRNPDSIKYFEKSENIALSEHLLPQLISARNGKAIILAETGQGQAAIEAMVSLLDIVEAPQRRGSILQNIGIAHYRLGHYDEAISYFFDFMRLAETIKDDDQLASAFQNMGNVYFKMKQNEKSLDFFFRALQIRKKSGNLHAISQLYGNIGLAYLGTKNFRKAVFYTNKALSMKIKCGDTNDISTSYNNLGLIRANQGKFNEALRAYNLALGSRGEQILPESYANLLNNMGHIYTYLKKYSKAREMLEKAYELASKINADSLLMTACRNLSDLEEATGNLNKSLQYARQQMRLQEKIFSYDSMKNIANVEAGYITEKIRNENELYRLKTIELVELNKVIQNQKQEMQVLLDHLQEALKTKNQLFSMIAHDLRTPFANLALTIEMILTKEFSASEGKEMLIQLADYARNTQGMLENLLNWAKNQTQRISVNPESFDLGDLIANVVAMCQLDAKQKRIKIKQTLQKDNLMQTDSALMEVIVRNLLMNAIKFSHHNSVIEVTASLKDENAVIKILDHGVGMTQEQLNSLQNSKRVLPTTGTASEKGFGLGLQLVLSLIEILEGTYKIRSKPGMGTTFTITMPTILSASNM